MTETREWDLQEAIRLYHEEGWSMQKLACHFGCAPQTVFNRLSKHTKLRCQRCATLNRWQAKAHGKCEHGYKRATTEEKKGGAKADLLRLWLDAIKRAVKAGDIELAQHLLSHYEALE